MTNFIKANFVSHGAYLTYRRGPGLSDSFIARTKYTGSKAHGPMITFLIKNFEVEEYLGRLAAGESPLPVLQSKGFMQPHVKKILKAAGYPTTIEGYKAFIQGQVDSTLAQK